MAVEAIYSRAVALLRFDAGVRKRIVAMLRTAGASIEATLVGAPTLTEARRSALKAALTEVKGTLAATYAAVAQEASGELGGLAVIEGAWTAEAALGGGKMPSADVLRRLADDTMIQGAPSREWWARQSGDAQFRFVAAIRQGVIEGRTNAQIARALRKEGGPEFMLRRNAEALVRTSVQAVSNAARMDTYRANGDAVLGVRQLSTLDSRTTLTCMAYDLQAWDLDGKPILGTKLPFNGGPPRHWNCRSTLVPVTDLSGGGTRASMDGPMPASLSFEEWLSTKDAEFQDELLGKGRAALWRSGKISFTQLLDQTGRPLTLEELAT